MKSPLNKAFSGWKIVLAISIGLAVSGWMLYSSLSQAHFVETTTGKGTHIWFDANQNGKVDFSDPNEFIQNEKGAYVRETLTSVLKNISWTSSAFIWLGIAVLAMIFRDLFYIIRIRLLTKNKLSWKASTYVILLWEFASALSPGVVGGSAVAMFILNRETIPFGKATAIVIITAFMDNLFFVLMIPLVFVFIDTTTLFPNTDGASLVLSWWFWTGFGIIFSVCLLLYLTLFWFPTLATRFLLFIFRIPFIKRWKFIALEWGKDIERSSKEFQKEPFSFWIKVFGSTFFSWISRYFVINAILNTFLELGFIDNIVVLGKQLVLWLFMLVSPTPGGSGVAEYAFSELLATFSSSAVLLTALALLWRLISYFPYLFVGAIVLPSWIKRTSN